MCVCLSGGITQPCRSLYVCVCVSASVRASVSRLAAVARGPLSVALPGSRLKGE